MLTPQGLRTEITTGTLSSVLAQPWNLGDDVSVVSILNDSSRGETMLKPIDMLSFAKFAASSGLRQKLKNAQSNPGVGAICDTAIEMLGQLSITFDPNDSDTQDMLAGLVGAGILTTGDQELIIQKCTQPASRYEVTSKVPGAVVTLTDVAAARKVGG